MPARPSSTAKRHHVVPDVSGLDGEQDGVGAVRLDRDAGRPDQHDRPGEAIVGDDDVAAPGEDEHRLAGGRSRTICTSSS